MKSERIHKICIGAAVAALYTALTFAIPAMSFGPVQLRISEAAAVLPAFYPPAVAGLTLGCFLSNLIGFFAGLNPLGLIDCAVGTAATLLSALATAYIGKRLKNSWLLYLLAPLPPVILNGVFVGAELSYFYLGNFSAVSFLLCFCQVAAGEAIACFIGGGAILRGLRSYFSVKKK